MIKELEEVRTLTQTVRELLDRYQEMKPGVRAAILNGMPKGERPDDALEKMIDAREEVKKRLDAKSIKLAAAQKTACAEMDRFLNEDADLHSFCLIYFFGAHTMEETCRIAGFEKSSFYRRMDKLKEFDKKRERMGNDENL